MGNTLKRNYPYPGVADAPDGPYGFQSGMEAVDADVAAIVLAQSRYLGRGKTSAPVLLTLDPGQPTGSWADLAALTATSRGKKCAAVFHANYANQNSGVHRTAVFRITVDAVEVQRWTADAPYRAGETPYQFASFEVDSTPSAAAHVWKLQGYASAASSVTVGSASISVTESAV